MSLALHRSARLAATSTRTAFSRLVPALPVIRARRHLQCRAAAQDVTTTVPTAAQNGAPMASTKDDVQGPMLTPSVVNTSVVRSLAMFAAVAAAAATTSSFLPARVGAFAHVLSYGLWLGANIWNTFFVGLTMFRHMPRQTFGRTQAALFPQYFTLTTGANIVLLATLLMTTMGRAGSLAAAALQPAAVTLIVGLVSALGNALFMEPKATSSMFARYALENKADKTEEDKSRIAVLQKEFGKLHGISSLLNLINSCAALAYGWFLASMLAL